MTSSTEKEVKIKLLSKIGFGSGDIYGGGAMIIVSTLYLIFLTDVVRISAIQAGLAIMLCKIWAAVFDVFFGVFTDRVNTRMGRRGPYILGGIPLIFISFVLLWQPAPFNNDWFKFLYVLGAYFIFTTVMGAVAISYNALSSEMSLDYHERTSIMLFRMLFAIVSALVCAVVPLEIIKRFQSPETGYRIMAVLFGLMFAIPYIFVFLTKREHRETHNSNSKKFSLKIFLEPFRIKTFGSFMLSVVSMYLAIDVMLALMIYLMTYCIGRSGITNYMLGLMMGVQILLIPIYLWLSRNKGKRWVYLLGTVLWIIVMPFGMFLKKDIPAIYFYIFSVFIGAGIAGVMSMLYAIYPDIPDVDELVSYQRREGLYAGIFIFMRKISSAFVLLIISIVLELTGYHPPENDMPQIQTSQFILAIKLFFTFCPILFLIVSFYAMSRFPLTSDLHNRLKRVLIDRKKMEKVDQEIEKEEKELMKELC